MPNGFTPVDKEAAVEKIREQEHVHGAWIVGEGVYVSYEKISDSIARGYTNLVENMGWYVAMYESRNSGDVAMFMPITEVPSGE